MSRYIRTKPATPSYRDGWERTFGKSESEKFDALVHEVPACHDFDPDWRDVYAGEDGPRCHQCGKPEKDPIHQ